MLAEEWVYVAVTYDTKQSLFYVNGEKVAENIFSPCWHPPLNPNSLAIFISNGPPLFDVNQI
ncbi:hypothetical protein CMK14_24415 [Candidatus Poribacteria bacterium]|nr:hypothetical protein [Candidatus Poribacteria bacterium]